MENTTTLQYCIVYTARNLTSSEPGENPPRSSCDTPQGMQVSVPF